MIDPRPLALATLVLFLPSLAQAQLATELPPPETSDAAEETSPEAEEVTAHDATETEPVPEGDAEEVDENLIEELDPEGATIEDREATSDGHWRGGDLVDEAFRDAFRAHAESDQELAALVSDVLLAGISLHAAFIDAVLTPLVRGEGERVWEAQYSFDLALGITLTLGEVIKMIAGRARPFERDCAEHPDRRGCDDEDRFSSFLSLHSGMSFTAAGYSCAMHLERRLFQDLGADVASCVTSLAVATLIGSLRIVADRHYFSDVISGATLGFLVGFLMPALLVSAPPAPSEDAMTGPLTASGPSYTLSVGGSF